MKNHVCSTNSMDHQFTDPGSIGRQRHCEPLYVKGGKPTGDGRTAVLNRYKERACGISRNGMDVLTSMINGSRGLSADIRGTPGTRCLRRVDGRVHFTGEKDGIIRPHDGINPISLKTGTITGGIQ